MMKVHLILQKDDEQTTSVQIHSNVYTIGRHEQCNLRVKSKTVSRRHCEITIDDDRRHVLVKDLGSRNGTIVNGRKLSGGESERLFHGDELRIGRASFLASIRDSLTDLPELQEPAKADEDSGGEQDTSLFDPEIVEQIQREEQPAGKSEDRADADAPATEKPPTSNRSDASSEKPAPEEPTTGPKRLPHHLRPQGPADSQQAADDALRRMFLRK
jgi:pSer/pThr/pTyr-binding forkhead associated (FHA) protein